MGNLAELAAKFRAVWPLLDERTRRLIAASEATALGYGGVSLVQRACGLSRKAIANGIREIDQGAAWAAGIRRPGAGRKRITASDPQLVGTLEALIEHQTRGDPESPLAVDLSEHADHCETLGSTRPPGQPFEGRAAAA